MERFRTKYDKGFGDVLRYIKLGFKARRRGWNGQNQFIVYQKGYPEGIAINKNTSEALGLPEGTIVKFLPYIMIRTEQGSCVAWLASQTDMLAEDWIIFE